MNIFYLDSNPKTCAEMHCDKHVVKMIIEYAQLMSTSHRILDGEEYIDKTSNGRRIKRWRMQDEKYENGLMKASHINHPSNIWVRASRQNYTWLLKMWLHLLAEYTHRYGKQHACEKYIDFLYVTPNNIPDLPFTNPTPAMPEECKITNNSLASYHKYYVEKKVTFAKWTKRDRPKWFVEGILQKMVDINQELGLYEDANIHI
jgi:hypothetical protein